MLKTAYVHIKKFALFLASTKYVDASKFLLFHYGILVKYVGAGQFIGINAYPF